VIVPGGFGTRGVEGIIKAIQFARENKIPYFWIVLWHAISISGVCFEMYWARKKHTQ